MFVLWLIGLHCPYDLECGHSCDKVGHSCFDPTSSADPGSPYALGGSGGAYSGTVPSSNQRNWAVGLHTFNVWDVTTGSATPVVKTFKVCVNGVPTC